MSLDVSNRGWEAGASASYARYFAGAHAPLAFGMGSTLAGHFVVKSGVVTDISMIYDWRDALLKHKIGVGGTVGLEQNALVGTLSINGTEVYKKENDWAYEQISSPAISPYNVPSNGVLNYTFHVNVSVILRDTNTGSIWSTHIGSRTISSSVVYDNVPPHITVSFGGATLTRDPDTSIFKYYANDSTVYVEWAASDSSDIQSIDLQGSHTSSVTSDTKLIYAAPKGSYGPWFATATDKAGNTNDYSDSSLVTSPIDLDTDGSFELVVDPDPPEADIALSSTSNIVDLAGRKFAKTSSVQLQITATDAVSGCKEIDLYLNGTLSSSLGTSASSATVTADEGANIAQIHVKDYAGNEAYTGGVTFYYNSSPPVGYINFSTQDSVLENGGKYWTKESQVNVDLTYGDGGLEPSGIYKGLVVLNGVAPTTKSQFTESLSGTSKTNHTVSGLNNGSNTISFYVINNVEKISAGDSITIWVETNDSTGTMAGVEATSSFFEDGIDYTNTNKHDVNLTHSDSDSQLF